MPKRSIVSGFISPLIPSDILAMVTAWLVLYTPLYDYTTEYYLPESETEGELSERQKDIINFVKEHQGCSKQDIVNGFDGKYSRVPLLKSVDDLEKLDVLIVRRSEQNRQTSAVFTNENNALVIMFDQLNEFERSYFVFLDKLAGTGKMNYPMPKGMISLVQSVPMFYEHFVGMCLVRAFIEWPHEIKDPMIATRLYNLLFSRLYDISIKLSDAYEKMGTNIGADLLKRYWNLEPKSIELFRHESKQFGLENYLEDTLNQLWKLSKNYAPYVSWMFKKGVHESMDNGEQPKLSTEVFDRLNDQLNYWNEDIRNEKKGRVKKKSLGGFRSRR